MASEREYLELLGLNEEASEDDIRRAYKVQALKCHPDKNPDDPDATTKFQKLSEAYTALVIGDDSEEEDILDDEDDVVFDLLRVFARLFRPDLFSRFRFGCDEYEEDSNEEYFMWSDLLSEAERQRRKSYYSERYRFKCEQGAGDNRRHQRTKNHVKKPPKPREPSKKAQIKKWKRAYYQNKEQWEKEKTTDNSCPHCISCGANHNSYEEEEEEEVADGSTACQSSDTDWEPDLSVKQNSNRRKKKGKRKNFKPEPPKELTAKELLSEQKRREKEMKEIGLKLEQQQVKEREKLAKMKQKEQQRREDLKQSFHNLHNCQKGSNKQEDAELKEQLLASQRRQLAEDMIKKGNGEDVGTDSTKSKSKRKREAKLRRRNGNKIESLGKPGCIDTKELEANDDSVNGWVEDEPVLKTVPAPPRRIDSVKDNSFLGQQRAGRGSGNLGRGRGNSGWGRGTFVDRDSEYVYKNPAVGPRLWRKAGGRGEAPVPPRMTISARGYNTKSGNGAPEQRPSQRPLTPEQRPGGLRDAGNVGMPAKLQPAPLPSKNIWQERKQFQMAQPSTAEEEEEMLRTALAMSRMETQETQLQEAMIMSEAEYNLIEQKQKQQEKVGYVGKDAPRSPQSPEAVPIVRRVRPSQMTISHRPGGPPVLPNNLVQIRGPTASFVMGPARPRPLGVLSAPSRPAGDRAAGSNVRYPMPTGERKGMQDVITVPTPTRDHLNGRAALDQEDSCIKSFSLPQGQGVSDWSVGLDSSDWMKHIPSGTSGSVDQKAVSKPVSPEQNYNGGARPKDSHALHTRHMSASSDHTDDGAIAEAISSSVSATVSRESSPVQFVAPPNVMPAYISPDMEDEQGESDYSDSQLEEIKPAVHPLQQLPGITPISQHTLQVSKPTGTAPHGTGTFHNSIVPNAHSGYSKDNSRDSDGHIIQWMSAATQLESEDEDWENELQKITQPHQSPQLPTKTQEPMHEITQSEMDERRKDLVKACQLLPKAEKPASTFQDTSVMFYTAPKPPASEEEEVPNKAGESNMLDIDSDDNSCAGDFTADKSNHSDLNNNEVKKNQGDTTSQLQASGDGQPCGSQPCDEEHGDRPKATPAQSVQMPSVESLSMYFQWAAQIQAQTQMATMQQMYGMGYMPHPAMGGAVPVQNLVKNPTDTEPGQPVHEQVAESHMYPAMPLNVRPVVPSNFPAGAIPCVPAYMPGTMPMMPGMPMAMPVMSNPPFMPPPHMTRLVHGEPRAAPGISERLSEGAAAAGGGWPPRYA